jgi:hypothetical protein
MFSLAVKHGLVLPEEMQYLAVNPPLTSYPALPLEAIASWSAQYLEAPARLNRNLSMTLRQLMGDRTLDAVLAVTMDRNVARRDQILTAMIDLYEQEWPHEPIAKWAHEQLGGWFYKEISTCRHLPVRQWPFRKPDIELESL